MQKDWLDNQLTDGLSDYSSQADFEGLWGKIEQKRKKKDRRRLFILLFFGLGLAAAGSWYYLNASEELIVTEQISTSKSKLIQQQQYSDENTINTPALFNTPTKEANQNATQTINEAKISVAPVSSFPNIQKQNIQIAPPPAQQNSAGPTSNKASQNNPVEKKQSAPKISLAQRRLLMTKALQSKAMKARANDHDEFNCNLIEPEFFAKRKGLWLSLDLFYGLHDQSRELIDPERSNYATRFNSAEEVVDVMGIQLGLKKYFHRNFFLQAGLGYTLMTDRFQDNYLDSFTQMVDDQLIKLVYSSDGTVEEVRGSQLINVSRERIKTAYKRSHFLHLPLLLGADLSLNERWGLSLAAGMSYTYLFKQSGRSYDFSLQRGAYRPLSEKDYSSRHLWQAQAQAQLYYRLQPRLQLTAGLRAQVSLNSLEAPELGWQEKWRLGALSLGMQWRLR